MSRPTQPKWPLRRGGRSHTAIRLVRFAAMLAVLTLAHAAPGQPSGPLVSQTTGQQAMSVAPAASEPDCIRCHTCAWPTVDNKCLPSCTRREWAALAGKTVIQQLPGVMILDALEDAYLPVPFDHRGHAQMAEMGGGCVICHHHTPPGQPHPACRTCHGISEGEADVRKPALLGAYHQQCLDCHREWINERDCDVCHRPKAARNPGDGTVADPTTDDILTQMHPPIPEPDTGLYRSRLPEPTETQVVFRHQDHAHRFGLRCVECHRERSCARCHAPEAAATTVRTQEEHHAPCIRCHRRDMDLQARSEGRCQRCHWRPGQPEPARFDHAQTGWPLGKYHQTRTCRECHTNLPFTKLDRACNGCHSEWSPTTFDHAVTGQILDANHVEQDCDVCHLERRFDRPPECSDCHDEQEDGISFPARRPGQELRVGNPAGGPRDSSSRSPG